MANTPYIKSGFERPPQRLIQHTPEYVRFEYYDANDALIDPDFFTVTFKYQDGTVIEDFATVPLLDKILTKESTGIYYYVVDLAAAQALGRMFAFPKGILASGEIMSVDIGIPILIIAEEDVESTENYCTVGDMASFTGRDFHTDSQPTRNEVQEQVDFVCGQINDYLRNQYDTPITGTRALAQLKMFTKIGVAAWIEMSIPRGRADIAALLEKKYNQYLKEIKAGTLPLTTTSDEGAQIAEPNLSEIIGSLGTDTAIADKDKRHKFDMADQW